LRVILRLAVGEPARAIAVDDEVAITQPIDSLGYLTCPLARKRPVNRHSGFSVNDHRRGVHAIE
jgi:hypothetical protein